MVIDSKEINDGLELRKLIENGVNPLVYIESDDDVDFVANSIVVPEKDSDPFWYNMATTLLKSLIYYTKATQEKENQTLSYCKQLLQLAKNHDSNNELTNMIEKIPFDHPGRMLYVSIKIAPEKTYKSIINTLDNFI